MHCDMVPAQHWWGLFLPVNQGRRVISVIAAIDWMRTSGFGILRIKPKGVAGAMPGHSYGGVNPYRDRTRSLLPSLRPEE